MPFRLSGALTVRNEKRLIAPDGRRFIRGFECVSLWARPLARVVREAAAYGDAWVTIRKESANLLSVCPAMTMATTTVLPVRPRILPSAWWSAIRPQAPLSMAIESNNS